MFPMKKNILLLLLLLTALAFPRTTAAVPPDTLDTLLFLLRANGHSLFANAISTSDLLFDLLSLPSLTLLAPPDPSLFALDMTHSPSSYLSSLHLHVIPSVLDLNPNSTTFNSSATSLPTLLPSRYLHVSLSPDGSLLLDGVQVLSPRLYYSRNSAIYHLLAALPSFHPNDSTVYDPPRVQSPNRTSFPPVLAPAASVSIAPTKAYPPVRSFWGLMVRSPPESPRSNVGADRFSLSPVGAVGVKRHAFKPDEECGPLDLHKMLCSGKSLSDVSDYHAGEDPEEDVDHFLEDYQLPHYASSTDYGL